MKSTKVRSIVITGLTGLTILTQAGCSSLGSHASGLLGQRNTPDSSPVQLGRIQSDHIGRPLPGSKTPVSPPITESKPEISDETRCHVALAMGEMLESVGNLDDAQVHFERALKSDPNSLNAALALARIYARQGRPDAALKVYQTAEKQHRRSAALFNDKGLLLADQKDWTPAIAALRTAVKLDSSESKYHNNLGMVLAASGNFDEAYKEFREAVGPGPAHFNVALMLLQAERPVEARNHLERAIAAMPTLQKAHDLLAQLDGRSATTSLASNEREVEVELDRGTADDRAMHDKELRTADDREMRRIDSSGDAKVERAVVDAAEPPANNAPSRATDADQSPWSRRWVPPKWLR